MKKPIRLIIATMVIMPLLYVPVSSAADMYKWVDESGNVIYSDRKPVDAHAENIGAPPVVDTARAQRELEQTQEQLRVRENQREAAEQQSQEHEKQQAAALANCQLAQDKLSRVNNNPRVFVEQEDGSRRRLTEEERQERIKKAEQEVEQYCR